MRAILRKLDRNETLTPDEYQQLMEYLEKIMFNSPESYQLFYDKYALLLAREYSTHLPRFARGIDDLVNYIVANPDKCRDLTGINRALSAWPADLQPYILYTFGQDKSVPAALKNIINRSVSLARQLPTPRTGEPVYKFEDQNPYKEPGLKAHFDRLGRYIFISRLQTYRYLTRNKASYDRIEYLEPDRLGGIFTNKEKSIYYYIFLTEADRIKAENAATLLNASIYGLEAE